MTWCTVIADCFVLTSRFVILCIVVPILLQMNVISFGFTMVMYTHDLVCRVSFSFVVNQAVCQLYDTDIPSCRK